MRTIPCAMMSATAMLAGAVAMAGPAAAIQAEKYTAPINVATGTVTIRASATFSDGSSADRLYGVRLDSDSDGDGLGDEVWLRVACSGGAVTVAQSYSLSGHGGSSPPTSMGSGRAVGSGVASAQGNVAGGITAGAVAGKWKGSLSQVQFWSRTAIVGQRVSWDLKEAKGSKTMAADSWHHRTIRDGAANLCV